MFFVMTIDEEKIAARLNYDRLVAAIPKRLSEREDSFGDKIKNSKLSPIKKLEALYIFMDELYEFVSKFTPCKKTCSSCCHYKVNVSEIEIAFIESHSKKRREKKFLPEWDFHGSPCPFLENDKCSIYSARPFVCRRHVVFTNDNTWCHSNVSNSEEFTLLKFTGIDSAFDHIRIESESFGMYDIRQVFD